jgi:hypothetical protein
VKATLQNPILHEDAASVLSHQSHNGRPSLVRRSRPVPTDYAKWRGHDINCERKAYTTFKNMRRRILDASAIFNLSCIARLPDHRPTQLARNARRIASCRASVAVRPATAAPQPPLLPLSTKAADARRQ